MQKMYKMCNSLLFILLHFVYDDENLRQREEQRWNE